MDDGAALLRAILLQTDEDTPRLVYADWLQEHGHDARAEFIRVQCEYALVHRHFAKHQNPRCKRCLRGAELSDLLLGRFKVPRQAPAPFADDCPHRIMGLGGYTGAAVEWDWTRGFVSDLRSTCGLFLDHAEAIFRAHPVTSVRLTDRAPDLSGHPRRSYGWQRKTAFDTVWADRDGEPYMRYAIPDPLFETIDEPETKDARVKYFRTAADARTALFAACVAYGRFLAGLTASANSPSIAS